MKLADIHIDQLTYGELAELRQRAEQRMKTLRKDGVPALRKRFIEESAALGVTLEEVAGLVKKPAGRPRKSRPNGKLDQGHTQLQAN